MMERLGKLLAGSRKRLEDDSSDTDDFDERVHAVEARVEGIEIRVNRLERISPAEPERQRSDKAG